MPDTAERRIVETLAEAETPFSQHRPEGVLPSGRPPRAAARWTSMRERCIGCVNKPLQDIVNPLHDRSSIWAMKAIVLPAFSPSGA